jgi:hypothetical protein
MVFKHTNINKYHFKSQPDILEAVDKKNYRLFPLRSGRPPKEKPGSGM